MGQSGSKGKRLFLSVLKHMLAERGLKVSDDTASEFYDFLMKVSPWFPEDGSLTLPDWKRVGKEMKKYTLVYGEGSIPWQAYPLWLQIRDILTNKTDLEFLVEETASLSCEAVPLAPVTSKSYGSNNKKDEEDDILDTEAEEDLEEEAARYEPCEERDRRHDRMALSVRRPKPKPAPRKKGLLTPVGFQGAIAQARQEGDATFAFPVIHHLDSEDEEPEWEPLPLKTLKELQSAVKQMGASAPYTVQIVDMVASQWLTPHDWHQTARATLAPGDYILWRTDYEERSKDTVKKYANVKKGPKVTMDMLLGTGSFLAPNVQVAIPKQILKEITANAVLAWRAIPPPGTKGTTLSGIRQSNEEPYQTFVSRLEEAISRMLPPSEGTDILLKQLAWENANSLCQDMIRPIRKSDSLQDYIKACMDASPAVVQGMAYAGAMKGQQFGAFVKQTHGGGKYRPPPTCFDCGSSTENGC